MNFITDVEWFIDADSGAIVSGLFEDELRFDIFVSATHYRHSTVIYRVVSTVEGDIPTEQIFYNYPDALKWINQLCEVFEPAPVKCIKCGDLLPPTSDELYCTTCDQVDY